MDFLPRIMAAAVALLITLGVGSVHNPPTPVPSPTTIKEVAVVSSFLTATTQPRITTTTTSVLAGVRCGQWWGLALELGWQPEDMETLDYVIWRESRCDHTQHNTTLNRDGSSDIGLTQINDRSWCLPTKWYPSGYLQSVGVLSTVGCEQLFDAATNLRAAKAIHEYHISRGQQGFEAWKV